MNPLYFPLLLLLAAVAVAVGFWVRHTIETLAPATVPATKMPPAKPAPSPAKPPPPKPAPAPSAPKPSPPLPAPEPAPVYGSTVGSSSGGDGLGWLLGGLFLLALVGSASSKKEDAPKEPTPPPQPLRCSCPNCINTTSYGPCTGCDCDKDSDGRCW